MVVFHKQRQTVIVHNRYDFFKQQDLLKKVNHLLWKIIMTTFNQLLRY